MTVRAETTTRRTALALASALLLMAWGKPALADETAQACAAAHEGAQLSKRAGKYLEALEQAKACTQAQCSPILVNECVKLYDDIQRDIPTFVFAAHDGDGAELVDVKVTMDGKPLTEKLDGEPTRLDPGVHKFRFEKPGLPPAEVTHTARVGDRNRLVEVTLGEKKRPAAAVDARVDAKPGIPTASVILGGIGVLGVGAFAYLRFT